MLTICHHRWLSGLIRRHLRQRRNQKTTKKYNNRAGKISLLLVLLSPHAQRFCVSRMRDFFLSTLIIGVFIITLFFLPFIVGSYDNEDLQKENY